MGGTPLRDYFLRSKGAGGYPRWPRGDDLTIFDRFWAPFWSPFGVVFRTFRYSLLCQFLVGSRRAFLVDFGRFWSQFWRHFGDFLATRRFSDFCAPCKAKPWFLRVGGGQFWCFFGVFFQHRFWTSICCDFSRFFYPLGLRFGAFWVTLQALFFS